MAEPEERSLGRIFISYRREDTAYPAGWLFERLTEHFGPGQVFKDIDSIEFGDDFVKVLTSAVGSCEALLALIGDEWTAVTDEGGNRRIDNPDDFVRLEIEAALARDDVRVVPILVAGASMPRAEELPPSLSGLLRRHALELRPGSFDFDTDRLLKVLDKTLGDVEHAEPGGPAARNGRLAPERVRVEPTAPAEMAHPATAGLRPDDAGRAQREPERPGASPGPQGAATVPAPSGNGPAAAGDGPPSSGRARLRSTRIGALVLAAVVLLAGVGAYSLLRPKDDRTAALDPRAAVVGTWRWDRTLTTTATPDFHLGDLDHRQLDLSTDCTAGPCRLKAAYRGVTAPVERDASGYHTVLSPRRTCQGQLTTPYKVKVDFQGEAGGGGAVAELAGTWTEDFPKAECQAASFTWGVRAERGTVAATEFPTEDEEIALYHTRLPYSRCSRATAPAGAGASVACRPGPVGVATVTASVFANPAALNGAYAALTAASRASGGATEERPPDGSYRLTSFVDPAGHAEIVETSERIGVLIQWVAADGDTRRLTDARLAAMGLATSSPTTAARGTRPTTPERTDPSEPSSTVRPSTTMSGRAPTTTAPVP